MYQKMKSAFKWVLQGIAFGQSGRLKTTLHNYRYWIHPDKSLRLLLTSFLIYLIPLIAVLPTLSSCQNSSKKQETAEGSTYLEDQNSANTPVNENKTIRICYTTWGTAGGEDLPGKGLIPDLAARVMRNAGYEVEVFIVPWPRVVEMTKEHKYDMVASAWKGENFDPYFEYLDVTFQNDINFIVSSNSPIKSGEIENFNGKTVGHVSGSGGLDLIRNNPSIKTEEVAILDKLIRMLIEGRIDAIISDPPNLFAAADNMGKEYTDQLKVLQPPLVRNYNAPLIEKHHPKLEQIKRDFHRSFMELIEKGLYEELTKVHGPETVFVIPDEYRKN